MTPNLVKKILAPPLIFILYLFALSSLIAFMVAEELDKNV